MKRAICSRCGKDLGRLVPDDATHVVCFACDQLPGKGRRP